MAGVQAEVTAPVLVVDTGSGIHDTGAEAQVVRLDQADRVALAIDDSEVDGAAPDRVGGGSRTSRPFRVDPPSQVRMVGRVQESTDRHVTERRVREVGIAVRHGQLGRLQPSVDPARVGDAVRPERARRGWLHLGQDAEQFQGHEAGAVGRVRGHPDPAVVEGDGRLPGRGVGAQVGDRDGGPGRLQRSSLLFAQVAVVKGVEALVRQGGEGRRQGRQSDSFARSPGSAVGSVHLEEPGVRPEPCRHVLGRRLHGVDEAIPCRETVPGQLDGRSEDGVARETAVAGMGVAPRADRARHGDGQRAAPRDRGQSAGAQRGGIGPDGSTTRAIEGRLLAESRVPDEPEGITADAAAAGHDHAKDGVGRDRCVHRGPARPQDVQTGRGREVMGRHDRTVRAPGQRDRGPGLGVHHSCAPAVDPTISSSRRRRANGISATASSSAVATSMPSIPRASAANPPTMAPVICPIARNTE